MRNFEDVPNERLLQKYISKYESRIGEYLGAKGNLEDIVRIYQTGYYTDEKDSATYMKKLLLELQETCKSAGDDIKAFFANINMKLKPSEIFEKEAVLKLRGKIEQRVKGYNQIASILVGLFITLPVTCSALNWVYPRFMNIFFPELANSKKSDAPEEKVKKGGHK